MKLRFPSFSQIIQQGTATFLRFPFVLLMALTGAAAAVWLVEIPWDQRTEYDLLQNFIFVSALGIPVFLSFTTLAESLPVKKKMIAIPVNTALLGLLILYCFSLPEDFFISESRSFFRYLLFFLAAHLFVSFSPFLYHKKSDVDDFWAYNKTLFLRILTSVLYTVVLFAGLSVAMLSLEHLLGFNIDGDRYAQLFIILLALFNTWFFLSGVPVADRLSAKSREYPGGLKVFVQYILIPLVIVYILILYLYMGKIILEWQWPNGWVANLVLSFSIAGIFSLLLLHPIRNAENHRWIRLFSRGYYIALIPLIILLVLSIWVRISEYGVTVNRYFVAVLAVWLTGIVIWFIADRKKNIKVIPVSLCLTALLISFGPWGAFEVSIKSQLSRFEQLLERNGLLSQEGKVIPAREDLPFEERREISSVVNYLMNFDGTERLQPYFYKDLTAAIQQNDNDSLNRYNDAQHVVESIGVEYVPEWQIQDWAARTDKVFHFTAAQHGVVPISGYDFYLGEVYTHTGVSEWHIERENLSWNISYDNEENLLRIHEQNTGRSVEADLGTFLQTLFEKHSSNPPRQAIDLEEMVLTAESKDFNLMVIVKSAGGKAEENITLQNASLELFLSEK